MNAAQQQPGPGWVTVLRDVVALTFPWVLIFKQAGIGFAPPAEVSEPILWLAGALLGVPGVGQILAYRFGGGTGMDGLPGPPASQDSVSGGSSMNTSGAEA